MAKRQNTQQNNLKIAIRQPVGMWTREEEHEVSDAETTLQVIVLDTAQLVGSVRSTYVHLDKSNRIQSQLFIFW